MRFDHMAFEVSDLEDAIAFYSNALGFTESWRHRNEEENEECVFLTLGDVRLELLVRLDGTFKGLPAPQTPYCPHLAIGVDDLDIAINQLKENKVSILRGPLSVEGKVRWLYFADPDHNVIELVQWMQ
ncbi:MAG: VOC family protein [Pirellulales bacterium]|nr:VOC family protein [Pirellulales bacterium]